MSLLISIPFGRTIKTAIERCKNIFKYVPQAIIIANFADNLNIDEFKTEFATILFNKIYINTIPRVKVDNAKMHSMFVKNLLHAHITNYQFAVQNNIVFSHIMFLSDMDYFYKIGLYDFIKVYDAGFFLGNSFIKPLSLDEKDFAPGEFVYQRHDQFWRESIFDNPDFITIYVEQIEGQFYRSEVFADMVQYIDKLPVHYSKAITNMEEGIFSNVYINLFQKKYPLLLPVSIILRDDSLINNQNRLYNVIIGHDIRKNNISIDSYNFYHPFTFGIKRISYDKNEDTLFQNILQNATRYIDILYHNIRTKFVYNRESK
jgi:hypothetical protein